MRRRIIRSMNTIQESIKRLIEQGKSQRWIARQLNVSQPTISRWAAGEKSDVAEAGLKLARLIRIHAKPVRKVSMEN